ncbi:MAG: DUF4013 domain-containing protein [Candidatus Coatesbacteria bacterium]|nr:DUF4013 domain-containing protein [Candidatus Coatesbacteria bacterium]
MQKLTVTKALKRVLEDDHWIRKTILGGFLTVAPVLSFFSIGYVLQVMRAAMRGETDESLPLWRAGESFLLGAKAFVLWVIYYIVPAAFLVGAQQGYTTSAFEPLLIIGIVLLVVVSVLFPWAISIWLSTGCVKSALEIRRTLKVFGFFGEYLDALVRCLLLGALSTGTTFACFFVSLACAQLMGQVTGKYLDDRQNVIGENEQPGMGRL